MNNLIQCYGGCGKSYELVDMHMTRNHLNQLCKSCHARIRGERHVENERHRQATLKERMIEQEEYRKSKKQHEIDEIEVKPVRKPKSKASKRLEIETKLYALEMARLEKGLEL